jgi:hypothetical protein
MSAAGLEYLGPCLDRLSSGRLRPHGSMDSHRNIMLRAGLGEFQQSHSRRFTRQLGVAGGKNDGQPREALLNAGCQLQPGHHRHGVIRDDQIDFHAGLELGQCLFGRMRLDGLVTRDPRSCAEVPVITS